MPDNRKGSRMTPSSASVNPSSNVNQEQMEPDLLQRPRKSGEARAGALIPPSDDRSAQHCAAGGESSDDRSSQRRKEPQVRFVVHPIRIVFCQSPSLVQRDLSCSETSRESPLSINSRIESVSKEVARHRTPPQPTDRLVSLPPCSKQ